MAYIPPHRRHSKDERTLSSLNSQAENLSLRHQANYYCAKKSISRYLVAGLIDDFYFPSSIKLEPRSCEAFQKRNGYKPLTLVHGHVSGEGSEVKHTTSDKQWLSIVEKIDTDLDSSFQNVRKEMESTEVKAAFVARIGKVFFHENVNLETLLECVTYSRTPSKSFYTNMPSHYTKSIEATVVPMIGFTFESEKDHYLVQVKRSHQTISCECIATKDASGLELRKAYRDTMRHLVADISCVDKEYDFRLMITTKEILKDFHDDACCIREILKYAVLDPDVEGGLRWPLGKETSGGWCVFKVEHIKNKYYRGPTMRIKLRDACRFSFKDSSRVVSKEVILEMKELSSIMKGDGMHETSNVCKMLQDDLKLIWDHFLTKNVPHVECDVECK